MSRLSEQNETLDIFGGKLDQRPDWIEAVVGIEQARERLSAIAQQTPGDYFIFYERTHTVVERITDAPTSGEKDDTAER